MITLLKKWGNSLAIRLPREVVRRFALSEGSEISIREEGACIVLHKTLEIKKTINKNAWRDFIIPIKKSKENISGKIDHILYGASR